MELRRIGKHVFPSILPFLPEAYLVRSFHWILMENESWIRRADGIHFDPMSHRTPISRGELFGGRTYLRNWDRPGILEFHIV